MTSKFFPFNKPFYKDYLFYGFLIVVYSQLSDGLSALVEYGYGNLVIQLVEVLLESVVLGWVVAILISGLRLYVTNRWLRRKKQQQVIGAEFKKDEVILTKFEKPIAEMTAEERRQAAKRHAENVLRNLDKGRPN
jgi:hypothetical protein